MKRALFTSLAAAAVLALPVVASAQSGGDAGSANKNVGAATTAPNNQSGTTDSRTTGATAPAPGGSATGGAASMNRQGTAMDKKDMKEDVKSK